IARTRPRLLQSPRAVSTRSRTSLFAISVLPPFKVRRHTSEMAHRLKGAADWIGCERCFSRSATQRGRPVWVAPAGEAFVIESLSDWLIALQPPPGGG